MSEQQTEQAQQPTEQRSEGSGEKVGLDRSDESQDFVDTSKLDFDPDDGLYTGTAVDGTTEIAGPHLGEDGDVEEPDPQQVEEGKQEKEQEHQQRAERMGNAGSGALAEEDSGE